MVLRRSGPESPEEVRVARERAMPPGIRLAAAGSSAGESSAGEWPSPPEHRESTATVREHKGTVVAQVFSPDGRLLATGDDVDVTIVWDMTDPAHPVPVARLPASDTPQAAGGSTSATLRAEGLSRHDRAGGRRPRRPRRPGLAGRQLPWRGLAFGPHHRLLATGRSDGSTELWWLTDPARPVRSAVLAPSSRRSGAVNSVAFSPDGRLLATGYGNGVVLVWDVSDPARPVRFWTPLGRWRGYSEVFTLAFSPDRRILAVGGFGGVLRPVILWDITGTRPIRIAALGPPRGGPFSGFDYRSSAFALAFSPDSRSLAVGADQRTQESWEDPPPEKHDSMVLRWDLTVPHQPRLATTLTQRGGVRNLPRSVVRRHEAITYTGHTATARAVAFSPDGWLLATGGDDRTVILWDVADPTAPHPIATLVRRTPIRALAFAPDRRVLATANGPTVSVWSVP